MAKTNELIYGDIKDLSPYAQFSFSLLGLRVIGHNGKVWGKSELYKTFGPDERDLIKDKMHPGFHFVEVKRYEVLKDRMEALLKDPKVAASRIQALSDLILYGMTRTSIVNDDMCPRAYPVTPGDCFASDDMARVEGSK